MNLKHLDNDLYSINILFAIIFARMVTTIGVSTPCCCIPQWALESVWTHLFRLSLSNQGWIEKLCQLCWCEWADGMACVCVCVLGACIDFASVVSGHQGHVAHASSNLHCGRRMRNSLIRNNSQILFMLTPVLIMAKQSAFFRGSWASIWCNWILLKLVCLVELCTGLWAFGCMVVFLIFTGILLTLERRNGKLNLACPQGFCWLRIPTHIAANTHAHIFVGFLSRKGVNHEPASQHCHWLPQQASPLVY